MTRRSWGPVRTSQRPSKAIRPRVAGALKSSQSAYSSLASTLACGSAARTRLTFAAAASGHSALTGASGRPKTKRKRATATAVAATRNVRSPLARAAGIFVGHTSSRRRGTRMTQT